MLRPADSILESQAGRRQSGSGVASFLTTLTNAAQQPHVSAVPHVAASQEGGLEGQIVRSMQRLWRGGGDEVRVTLHPEYLGAVTIALRVEQDSVTAVLHVEEPQVRAWVESHQALLRQSLSEQGLTLSRLVVTDEPPGQGRREREGNARQSRHGRRRESADPRPAFEVAG
jgi:flagellar hook-length control protein FliK